MLADKDFTARRDKQKRIRFIGEGLFLLAIIAIIVKALFIFSSYQPYTPSAADTSGEDHGFIALSYFGVSRTGTNELISADLLDEHLAALKQNGYVTLTGKEVQDYYKNGAPLPRHALFLNFEDGRRDTLIFAEKILEKYNYHGMISTYAENLRGQDNKFLRPDELKDLTQTGYWELGSNGYRLYYINVFDRWHHYLGNMNPLVYSHLSAVLGRDYNHYLMDYIRDDKDFPVETYQVMKDRISSDYTQLQNIYTDEVGYVPDTYILMHANTGRFGNQPDVSRINEMWIRKLFKMNFNREGNSHNDRQSSIYDLTRIEPQPYWPVNHLLMRLYDDGATDLHFIDGDENQYQAWDITHGAAEFKDEQIILTSEGGGSGEMTLKNSQDFTDLNLAVTLLGNQYGTQKIFLRQSGDKQSYLVVALVNNHFVAGECNNGEYRELQNVDLQTFDGPGYLSEAEDQKQVAATEKEVLARYAPNTALAKKQLSDLASIENQDAQSVAEGAPAYEPPPNPHLRGQHKLNVELHDNLLSVQLDDKPVVTNATVARTEAGSLSLAAAWPGYGNSQKNLADDVYDAVFAGLKVTQWDTSDKETVLYDVHYHGLEKVKYKVRAYWHRLLNWVLAHF